jgi:hypothetical protein
VTHSDSALWATKQNQTLQCRHKVRLCCVDNVAGSKKLLPRSQLMRLRVAICVLEKTPKQQLYPCSNNCVSGTQFVSRVMPQMNTQQFISIKYQVAQGMQNPNKKHFLSFYGTKGNALFEKSLNPISFKGLSNWFEFGSKW